MIHPPPGFIKPIWRGWEERDVRTKLAVAVTAIDKSLGGCHREAVSREETHCPSSSNQHHYVRQVPHTRHEVIPRTSRKNICKGIVNFPQKICLTRNIFFRPPVWRHESEDGNSVCYQDESVLMSKGWRIQSCPQHPCSDGDVLPHVCN